MLYSVLSSLGSVVIFARLYCYIVLTYLIIGNKLEKVPIAT